MLPHLSDFFIFSLLDNTCALELLFEPPSMAHFYISIQKAEIVYSILKQYKLINTRWQEPLGVF